MGKKVIYIGLFIVYSIHQVYAQKIYFNGLGRTLLANSRFHGRALDNDTASARKKTTGYILFYFGLNYQPTSNLRASATIRLRNELGGFYGNGNHLFFRQFKIEGILLKSIKIDLGDLDLGLTPYTLYNFDEIYHDYESEIFSVRRRITNYENFNFGNNWRLQGGQISSDLKFGKVIEKIGFRGFLTNNGRYDYFRLPELQNFISGGRIDFVQSRFFRVGGNYTGFTDVRYQPLQNNISTYVFTADGKINIYLDSLIVSLYGEAGKSTFKNKTFDQKFDSHGNFYDAGISANIKPWSLNLYGTYKMVEEDFASPGAQTRRIFDYGTPQLFSQTDNNTRIRPPSLYDRFADESIRNLYIRPTPIPYLPQYNNISPYGIATPNRQGFSFGFNKGSIEKILIADARVDLLNEVKADIGETKRSFVGVRGGLIWNIHKLFDLEKNISINFGIRSENTKRNSDHISLKSNLWDAGISMEIVKDFDLLLGYKFLDSRGNEFILTYSKLNDRIIASGLRYRFTRNTFITAQGHWVKNSNINIYRDYKINQLFINFTLIF